MTAARWFDVMALTLFVVSCACYRKERKVGGDRLLFLAYGAMICGWCALFRAWGVM